MTINPEETIRLLLKDVQGRFGWDISRIRILEKEAINEAQDAQQEIGLPPDPVLPHFVVSALVYLIQQEERRIDQ